MDLVELMTGVSLEILLLLKQIWLSAWICKCAYVWWICCLSSNCLSAQEIFCDQGQVFFCLFNAFWTELSREWADACVEMIIVLETSMNWAQDIQIICDLMIHNGHASSCVNDRSINKPPRLIGCNFDMTYVGAHETPRLGPGAFVHALDSIYSQVWLSFSRLKCCGSWQREKNWNLLNTESRMHRCMQLSNKDSNTNFNKRPRQTLVELPEICINLTIQILLREDLCDRWQSSQWHPWSKQCWRTLDQYSRQNWMFSRPRERSTRSSRSHCTRRYWSCAIDSDTWEQWLTFLCLK